MRFLIVLLGAILAAPVLAQSRGPALAGLDAEFAGRVYTTRIPVGIYNVYFFRSQQFQQFMQRGVETRVSADGRIYYVAVGMHYPLQSGGLQLTNTEEVVIKPEEMIPPAACTWREEYLRGQCRQRNVVIPAGTKVTVSKWTWGSDKVSLELSVGLGSPRVTFIFGKGFESSATRESILSVISRALILEDFEHLQRAEAEYADLRRQLDAARSAYASAADSERLKAGEEFQLQLRAMAQNRSTKEQLTRGGSAGESVQYTKEATDLEPTLSQLRAVLEASLSRLREQAKNEQRQALRKTYDAIVDEAKQLRARAGVGGHLRSRKSGRCSSRRACR